MCLDHSAVAFVTHFNRPTMIRKLCTMMGFDMSDPDDTDVLTIDNMKKMLAIQMRFRYKCV